MVDIAKRYMRMDWEWKSERIAVGWVSGGGGGEGKVTPGMLLVIARKDRESEIKHFENEFG